MRIINPDIAAFQAFRREMVPLRPLGSLGGMAAIGTLQRQVFESADTDRDGALTAAEFAALGKSVPGEAAGAESQALFATLDRDGDGKLAPKETQASRLFEPANLRLLLGLQADADLGGWLAARSDQDGDGGLSFEEYSAIAGVPMRAGRVGPDRTIVWESLDASQRRAFDLIDGDRDGALTSAELAKALAAGPAGAPLSATARYSQATGALLANNDADGDGALSGDEIAAAAKAAGTTVGGPEHLVSAADADGDGRLGSEELEALAARRRAFLDGPAIGASRYALSAGELLFARLLHATVDRLSDTFAASRGAALDRIA